MNSFNILIVDDEENILKSLKRTFLDEDYRIITATSGEQGLSRLRKLQVDLVISDFRMPGMSGVAFLESVKAKYPDVLTILLTAHADMDVAIEAINTAGVYKFIKKPWDEIEMKIIVKRALENLQVIRERDRLLNRVKNFEAEMRKLERKFPGITKVERDADGYIISRDDEDND